MSELPDEFPGVTEPSLMKQGFNFWKAAGVQPGRGNSSLFTSTFPVTSKPLYFVVTHFF